MADLMYDARDNRNDPDPGIKNPNEETDSERPGHDPWLQMARDAFSQSDDYFEANMRSDIEANLAHFQGRHAPGSKYYTDQYKYRAKGFRPKTRSMERKKESAAAQALFSTSDAVNIKAERTSDEAHRVSAEINQELLQYRLENNIEWFLTAMGAYQDTLVSGVCISHQYWDYREVELKEPEFDDMGNVDKDEEGNDRYTSRYEVIADHPQIDLRPIENLRFSIAADWRDPINTSPYLIDMLPMTVDEVKLMTKQGNKTAIPWFEVTDNQLLTARTTDYDSVRQMRENNREDSKEEQYSTNEFNTVWVFRIIVRLEGRDWIYYTLGEVARLSDPIPLEMEYPHLRFGERPYVLGISNIETHKNYPDSLVKIGAGAQKDANEINNQRRDNVMLALNRRYIIRRGAVIDYQSLQLNAPGGVTETDDPNTDIKIESPQDVTASSYQEQDRINQDYDEVTGHFSTSSVASNRNLNETVGGMNLLSSSADALTEYPLRIFVETWVLPVLKQLVRLEQRHESDRNLLFLMGEKINMWDRFGKNVMTDAWIQGNMNIEVNVGFGATSPQQRINRLATGLQTIYTYAPGMQAKADEEEISREVLGALGFSSAERFFPDQDAEQVQQQPDPEIMKLNQEYKMHDDKLQDAQLSRMADLEKAAMAQETELMKMYNADKISQREFELKMQDIQVKRQNFVDEVKLKITTGLPGI